MTSEHIGNVAGGRHAAATPSGSMGSASEFHYHDRERLASYRRTEPIPPLAQAGAFLTLLVGGSVLFAEWALYPQSSQGQSDDNWALGFLILSSAGALRILVGNPGRHMPSVAAILIAGLGFLFRAFLVTADPSPVYAFEITCGVLLVAAALMAWFSPADKVEPPPATNPWG